MTYSDLPPVTDVAGVAEILGCHPDTVRHLIDSGQLKSVHLGRLIRVPRHAVVEFLRGTPASSDLTASST